MRNDKVTLANIHAARERIRDKILLSPCTRFEALGRSTNCEILIKLENLQMTGSFKDRGALNMMLQLSEKQKACGVIAASAGNHAQAVAHAANLLGVHATIVMPETAPLTKIDGTKQFGAEVILSGSSYDAAYASALEIQRQRSATLVPAFDHPHIICGQGSIGLELLEQVPDLDLVVVPVGGGGLISGIAAALRETRPEVRVVGVQTSRLPAMKESLRAGSVKPLRPASTIADGISVATVGHHTLPIVRRCVSAIVTVTEDEIASAIMSLLENEKTLAEGAGAVGVAAVSTGRIRSLQGKKVVIVISGGNIDMTRLSLILERGLETDERLARFAVIVPDKPGSIAAVASIVAKHQANILQVAHRRDVGEVELGEVEIELTLETRGRSHVRAIIAAIRNEGLAVK